ncbi:hypothetical protein [Endozoicomonas sp.]|uniref:hypothetical protein n=1 Tax=Endozoicomonas sp. TaxID=1892382 RepID=UPI003AF5B6AA
MGISLFTLTLLSGCGEQQAEIEEAIQEAKAAAQEALEQVQEVTTSTEAGEIMSQAQDAFNEIQANVDPEKFIEMAGDQAVQVIEEAQKATIEAIQESKDDAKEALEQ